jgi:hypothetical protein
MRNCSPLPISKLSRGRRNSTADIEGGARAVPPRRLRFRFHDALVTLPLAPADLFGRRSEALRPFLLAGRDAFGGAVV